MQAVAITTATIIKKENGMSAWKLGNTVIGSWHGPAPVGAVYIRSGLLNLNTGNYFMFRPNTDMFHR